MSRRGLFLFSTPHLPCGRGKRGSFRWWSHATFSTGVFGRSPSGTSSRSILMNVWDSGQVAVGWGKLDSNMLLPMPSELGEHPHTNR